MKVFTQTFDLAKASPHRFWVAPYSDFKIGIKILAKGEVVDKDFTVKAGAVELTPDEDKIDGFTLYTLKSGDTGFVEYTIEVEDIAEKLKLTQIVTDSTVFEVGGSGGGDVPADVATQTWVNSQISDFVDEDELTAYATKDELTGYVENGDLTAYYTKSETSSATELADAFAGAGGGSAISAFDMSEDPVMSKAIVEAALNSNTCLPQTIAHYTNGSISAFNIVGQMNKNNFVAANADKVIIGSNVSSMNLPFNVGGSNSVLKEVIFSPQVTNVTLQNCYELTSVIFPKDSKVSYLDEHSFQSCRSLSSLSLPNNIGNDVPWQQGYNAIGLDTFNGCTSLKYLRIPDSVKKIARTQFAKLSCAIDYGNTRTNVPTLEAYDNGASKCYVPDNLYDQWIATSQWSAGVSAIYRQSDLYAPYATAIAESKVAGGAETGTTGTPAAITTVKSVYETDWATLSATAVSSTFYIVLPDPA